MRQNKFLAALVGIAALLLAGNAGATVTTNPYVAIVAEGTAATQSTFGFPAQQVQIHNDGTVTEYCLFDTTSSARVTTSIGIPIPAGKAKNFDFSKGPVNSSPALIDCITASSTASTRIEAYPWLGATVGDTEAYSSIPSNVTVSGNFVAADQGKFSVQNQADATKQLQLNLSGMTTANTIIPQLLGTAVAPIWQWGPASATPGVSSTYGVAGTGTNIAGGTSIIGPGAGTGNGAGAATSIQRNLMAGTGSSAQTQADAFKVCESKTLSNTSATLTTVATLATASNSAGSIDVDFGVTCNDGSNYNADHVRCTQAWKNHAGTLAFGTQQCTASVASNDSGSCTIAPTFTATGSTLNVNVTPVITTIVPTTTTGMVTIVNHSPAAVTCN